MSQTTAISLNHVELCEQERLPIGEPGWDRLLGGGAVRGSLSLLGGILELGNLRFYYRYQQNLLTTITKYCMSVEKNR